MKKTLGWIAVGMLIGASGIVASQAIPEIPVSAEGMLVEAAWNTDRPDEKIIEGSVSFKVDVPMSRIQKHMLEPGTWGKISPNVSEYTATMIKEDERHTVYRIEETITPTQFPPVKGLAATRIGLLVTIVKRATQEADAIAIRWTLDPDSETNWKQFDGRIYAVDLHTGKTMVMVTTSSKSGYDAIPERVRLKLVEHYLAQTKDSIVNWLRGLD